MNRTVKILITVCAVVILLITGILVFMEKKTDDLNDYEKNQEQNTEDPMDHALFSSNYLLSANEAVSVSTLLLELL